MPMKKKIRIHTKNLENVMIKENMLSIYTIKSLNYERCEQRFVNYKCLEKNMQCLILY